MVPTILDILDIPTEGYDFDGRSLLPLLRNEIKQLHSFICAEETFYQYKRAIRTDKYKYIQALSEKSVVCRSCGIVHGGFEELYNLKEDPEEENNIIENDYEIAMELRDTLSKWVEHIENKKFEKAKIKEKIKRLRSFDKI